MNSTIQNSIDTAFGELNAAIEQFCKADIENAKSIFKDARELGLNYQHKDNVKKSIELIKELEKFFTGNEKTYYVNARNRIIKLLTKQTEMV